MKIVSYTICILVAVGAFATGSLISGAETILRDKAVISATIDQPLVVLVNYHVESI